MALPKRITDLSTLATVDVNSYMEVDKAGWAESQKMLVSKLLQTLSYNSATKVVTLSDGNTITLDNTDLSINQVSGLYSKYASVTEIRIYPGGAKDSTWAYDLQLSSSMLKSTSNWSVGNNGGGMQGSTLKLNQKYFIHIIGDSTGINSPDIVFNENSVFSDFPVGYDIYQVIGQFMTLPYSTNIASKSLKNWIELNANENANNLYFDGFKLPKNYSEIESFSYNLTTGLLSVKNIRVRDDTDAVNIEMFTDSTTAYTKSNAAFAVGDGNGYLLEALVANTNYYVFLITKYFVSANNVEIIVTSDSTPSLPAGYTYKAIIGYGYTDELSNLYIWKNTEGWEDENFDFASIVKTASLEATAPTYEDLFTTGIKVGCFSGAIDNEISLGKEYAHSGKAGYPIFFHFHWAPETNGAGNADFYVTVLATNSGDVVGSAITKNITIAMPTIAKKVAVTTFAVIPGTTFAPGTQLAFKFGRLGSSDTYNSKIAVRTFGYHYLKDREGSQFIGAKL